MSECDKDAVEFGRRLRKIRKRQGFEQAALAEIARVPTSSISHFEHGKHKPSYDSLVRLACALDVSLDYLAGRTKNPHAHESGASEPPNVPLTAKQVEDIEIYIDYLKERGRYSEDWAPVVGDKKSE